jgi:hypothetical protein
MPTVLHNDGCRPASQIAAYGSANGDRIGKSPAATTSQTRQGIGKAERHRRADHQKQ